MSALAEERAGLKAEWRRWLDWADENDDEGGHVGISRRYRVLAAEAGERLRQIDAELVLAGQTAEMLAAIRARLDALQTPPETTERRRRCPSPDCWHDIDPCAECIATWPERKAEAERMRRTVREHALGDLTLLLPVVEALLADGEQAARAALRAQIEQAARRAELDLPLPRLG